MNMHGEAAFEAAIEADLLAHGGYEEGDASDFDAERGLFQLELFDFIERSQAEVWNKLVKQHGDSLKPALLDALTKHLDSQGALNVIRHGFKFYGQRIYTAFFKPAHGLNPETELRYEQNTVAITRQVYFHPNSKQSVDMVVSVNGLPVATLELKNPLTGQTTVNAVKQYLRDRDPKVPLFRFDRGALVHFAVDPDTVSMTTKLAGGATRFLPFNQGDHGGAGNPSTGAGYKTAYLWREVLQRDSLLDLLARFLHLEVKDEENGGQKVEKKALIFPRYHQLDVVRRLEATAKLEGAGHRYLVQHSAGSGKSNSIAWVAHRLASLHDDTDERVFHSVVVITDRRVLDKQLQDTIYQFEHKQGVVARIDKDSSQLAEHLEQGTSIIITTLQKFPVVAEKIGNLTGRRFAVIVDEAHSSQTGTSAQKLKQVLAGEQDSEESEGGTWEDEINAVMSSRGPQQNLSFFAFTATPKAKTLEVFGRKGADGKPVAFHLYSMRQAIEEGFILDVLKSFTTYGVYYKLVQTTDDDPDVKKREAGAALARFVSLHPYNIAQKVEVIVEHFRTHVRHKIDGRAKAMVVTRSRLHAVRYKQAIDEYITEKGYQGLGALVAFSGTVTDPDTKKDFTELGMNDRQQNEKELPDLFRSSKWQVLIVANKYQTGFDEPLLHTMYVDRRLSGVQAVQTLSRLNRMHPGKDDTFVLDFVNDADTIRDAFQPFYEATTVSELADPGQLDQLQHELDEAQMWQPSELEAFSKVFYKPKDQLTKKENEQLYQWLQPAVDRFKAWDDVETREDWRSKLATFVRLYAFLSQVMPYTDRELEMRFAFGRMLLRRLPRPPSETYDFEGEVDLHSYRLSRKGEAPIVLEKKGSGEVKGPTAVGTGGPESPKVPLHTLIEGLNERFGTELNPEDQLFFDHVVEAAKSDADLRTKAKANTYENFALAAADSVQDKMIEGLDTHGALVESFLNNGDFKKAVLEYAAKRIWKEIRAAGVAPAGI